MAEGLLSVVVTSYTSDRLADMRDLIDSLKSQSYPRLELVFVAERESGLKELVKTYAGSIGVSCTALFNGENPGLSPSRNMGAASARGDIIAFADDDVVLAPDWAAATMAAFDDPGVIGATGPALPLWQGKPLDWLPVEFYWLISCTSWYDPRAPGPVRNAWGHSMAFRRHAFDVCRFSDPFGRTAGFDKGGKKGPVGDDTEFCINLTRATGKKIIYDPAIRVRHKVYPYRLTAPFIRRQAFWQGYTKAMLNRVYEKGAGHLLDTEYSLLRRIAFSLLPSLPWEFITAPGRAWRKTRVIFPALFHLAAGYAAAAVPGMSGLRKSYSS